LNTTWQLSVDRIVT